MTKTQQLSASTGKRSNNKQYSPRDLTDAAHYNIPTTYSIAVGIFFLTTITT